MRHVRRDSGALVEQVDVAQGLFVHGLCDLLLGNAAERAQHLLGCNAAICLFGLVDVLLGFLAGGIFRAHRSLVQQLLLRAVYTMIAEQRSLLGDIFLSGHLRLLRRRHTW